MTQVLLELHVSSFNDAETFYNALGFEKVWQNDLHNGYMVMKKQQSILQFYGGDVSKHSFFRKYSNDSRPGYGVEICVSHENISEIFHKMKAFTKSRDLGAVVADLQTRPWGLKDFRMIDPFGYYIRITEPYNPQEER